jgi:hypothetical protein
MQYVPPGMVYVQGCGWSQLAPDMIEPRAPRVHQLAKRPPVRVTFSALEQAVSPGWDANGSPVEAA